MFTLDKTGFSPVVTLDKANTNYKELSDILDEAGQYPVQGKDISGSVLCVSWVKKPFGKSYCTVWEPGTEESGTKITSYFKNGSTEVSYIKD